MQEGAIVRGDLAKMVMGKYVTVGQDVTMHPVFYPRAQGCVSFPQPFPTVPSFSSRERSLAAVLLCVRRPMLTETKKQFWGRPSRLYASGSLSSLPVHRQSAS